jgi:tRNA nucleotidyltransferase (CCA-adding enzyme)
MKETLRASVLARIVPTPDETATVNQAVADLLAALETVKPADVESMLVGSVAKDTFLRTALDIDVFLLFPPVYEKKELGACTIEAGKKVLSDWVVQYAEHPYIRGRFSGFRTDIVPAYKVAKPEQMLSAVDRTPFHTEYVIKHLKSDLKDEVRLLKQFLRGVGCYGAEAKIEGFSGYLTELLVLYYGSFERVLQESRTWETRTVLSLEKTHEISTFGENFVVIDPVDPSRNVAAALSEERQKYFMYAAKKFIEQPRKTFFFPLPPPLLPKEELRSRLQQFVGVCFPKPNIVDDTLFPQLKKAMRNLVSALERHDFEVLAGTYHATDDIAFFAVHLKSLTIEKERLHVGPPENVSEHAETFVAKWRHHPMATGEPFVEKGRWRVRVRREDGMTDARTAVRRLLPELSLGKDIDQLKDVVQACTAEQLQEFSAFWTEYFSDVDPWDRTS